jgi:hypothetical protein
MNKKQRWARGECAAPCLAVNEHKKTGACSARVAKTHKCYISCLIIMYGGGDSVLGEEDKIV